MNPLPDTLATGETGSSPGLRPLALSGLACVCVFFGLLGRGQTLLLVLGVALGLVGGVIAVRVLLRKGIGTAARMLAAIALLPLVGVLAVLAFVLLSVEG